MCVCVCVCVCVWHTPARLFQWSWAEVGQDHIEQLSGRVADHHFLQQLTFIATNHDERIRAVDTVRAWHSGGGRVIVELHIVLDPLMTLREVGR